MADGYNREPMMEMYLFESGQLLEQLEEIILKNEVDGKLSDESINEIFRIMHTIKGSSSMMFFNNIAELSHAVEDLFSFIRENKPEKIDTSTLSDYILSCIDFIKNENDKIQDSIEADGNPKELISKIKELLTQIKNDFYGNNNDLAKENKNDSELDQANHLNNIVIEEDETSIKYKAWISFEKDCQMENIRAYNVINNLKNYAQNIMHIPKDILEDEKATEQIHEYGFTIYFSSEKNEEELGQFFYDTIFIQNCEIAQIEQFDQDILELYGLIEITNNNENKEKVEEEINEEVAQNELNKTKDVEGKKPAKQSMIAVNISKLDYLMDLVGEIVISESMVIKNPDLKGLELDNFQKAARQLRKLTDELQDSVMSIRMLPVDTTFQKMKRIVRDVSKKLNKKVQLELIGEETEVDKNIIDHLGDPLMHLIRNAVDHGIETVEDRVKSGKPEMGTIRLEAKNSGRDVWIIVQDNGKGLNRENILNKAIEKGLFNGDPNDLSDKEVFSFILEPGFSTKAAVTEYSGRGVGMDVVNKNLAKIGGTIVVESVEGVGTTISLKIPLTLAIIDGMAIKVGDSKYTLPITSIKESLKIKEKDVIRDSDNNELVMIRGECYQIHRIHKLFDVDTNVTNLEDGILIIVESDAKTACLFADELIGEQQVVVKALPKYIKKLKGIAGCTILGDGNISLIIDINSILENY